MALLACEIVALNSFIDLHFLLSKGQDTRAKKSNANDLIPRRTMNDPTSGIYPCSITIRTDLTVWN